MPSVGSSTQDADWLSSYTEEQRIPSAHIEELLQSQAGSSWCCNPLARLEDWMKPRQSAWQKQGKLKGKKSDPRSWNLPFAPFQASGPLLPCLRHGQKWERLDPKAQRRLHHIQMCSFPRSCQRLHIHLQCSGGGGVFTYRSAALSVDAPKDFHLVDLCHPNLWSVAKNYGCWQHNRYYILHIA